MVEVGTYATRSEAELTQAALVAAGVTSRLLVDDAGGAYPFDLTGGARVLVDEADVQLAARFSERTERIREGAQNDLDDTGGIGTAQSRRGRTSSRSTGAVTSPPGRRRSCSRRGPGRVPVSPMNANLEVAGCVVGA